MKYNYLGRSNLMVSRICLGTMHFGKVTEEKESFEIMDRALELGINFFDTADIYGGIPGQTEEIIGRWFKLGGGRREKVVLGTKVYWCMVGDQSVPNEQNGISTYKVNRHLNDSQRRLQTDYIDLYQVHHIDRRITGEEFWGTFERLTAKGDVTYIGTSNFPGWGLAKFQMMARQRGLLGIISEQTQYNLLNRMPELEVIPAARDFGIGILAYMPLAGGLLSGKKNSAAGSRTNSVEKEYGIELGGNSQMEEYSRFCREIGEKENIVAIAWTLSNPAVSSSVIGVRSLNHLDQIERAVELKLDHEMLNKLDEIFNINRGRPLRPGEAPEAYSW